MRRKYDIRNKRNFLIILILSMIIIGIFSLLYGILPFSMEIDQAFIAAILTIIGYSVQIIESSQQSGALIPNIFSTVGATFARPYLVLSASMISYLSLLTMKKGTRLRE